MSADPNMNFRKSDVLNRQTAEVVGFARGILADGYLTDSEIEAFFSFLVATEEAGGSPLCKTIRLRIEDAAKDGVIDDDERAELFELVQRLVRSDFEVGEVLKATSLPLCDPAPDISFLGKRFCFTGTFTFGKRRDCECEVVERGASVSSVNGKTNFLVIGEYATDSWAQSTFGRKIEKAMELRESGKPIHIVSEAHWRSFL